VDISITLLHSNDMHGDFHAEKLDERLLGGVSRLSGYLNRVRGREENVLYAIAGDMLKGSVIDSEFQGLSTIEVMNLLAPDVATIGNHEVDYGIAHLLFLEKCAKFPIINANLYVKSSRARLFAPCWTCRRGGLKLLFIGAVTAQLLHQAKREALLGAYIDVKDAEAEIRAALDAYRGADVDCTILLTHVGFEEDRALARALGPRSGVDLIVGGHSHTLLAEPHYENGIPIVQAGCGTDQVGRAELRFDAETRALKGLSWRLVDIDDRLCPRDMELEALLAHYAAHTDAKYGGVLTRFPRALTHPARDRETELGNLFADLLQDGSGLDIIFFASGSIRSESLGPIVEYGGLRACLPFDDALIRLEVTGAELADMLLFMLRRRRAGGHAEFYQLSAGVEVCYNTASDALSRLRFRGAPVEADMRFTIALQSYHYNNFEAFFGFAPAAPAREIAASVFSVLAERMAARPLFDAHVEGRITEE